ncbi:hypothetical protein niasHS_007188 [Heterodera schachtii]|uniref:Elongator complex protein 1 n=1 Tax=Heterodera schachtii TaxID=97005 RepID=A0ABD2JJL4_HETSC
MKNLRVSHENTVSDEKINALFRDAMKMCVDSHDDLLFVALKDGRIVAIDRQMKLVEGFGHSITKMGWDGKSRLIGFDYLYDDQQLCLLLDDGKVLLYATNTKEFKCAIELKRNVLGCSWSPDLQLLIVATDSHLLMVSREFQVIAEAPLRPTTAGKDQLLTIGWGSAETQFQGSVGKQNVHKQDQHRMPIPIREEFDDQRVIISWRGDAFFFAVSSVDEVIVPKQTDSPSKNGPSNRILCRQLRIWNRELDFMSQCDFLAGLEAACSIKPRGNLIVVPAVVSNERHLWFYERNGEIRNKLKLFCPQSPSSNSDCDGGELHTHSVVRHLAWNSTGSILMLCYEDILSKTTQLQFWVVSNYSWTEKLRFSVGELADFFWDPEDPNKFHYLTKLGVYHRLILCSEYNCEDMIVVSINGDRVRVTDFKYAPIPPPMCHYELCLDFVGTPSAFAQSPVFGLAFLSSDFTRISTFSLQNRRFIRAKRIELGQSLRLLLNLIWRDANALLAFRKSKRSDGAYELIEFHLDPFSISSLREFDNLPFALSLINAPNGHQLPNWTPSEENCVKVDHAELEENKYWLTLCRTEAPAVSKWGGGAPKTIKLDGKDVLIFYLNSAQLFVNGKKFHLNVFNYCCTKEFLALISGCSLFCFPIALVQKFVASDEKTFECIGAAREVERLSELIANEPNGTRVWLQMPRGNLEVIHPRPILLERLKLCLDAREWSKAFVEMRRHRIDLNLLYDHNPKAFIESIEQFVAQVNDVESLCVFLTSLKTVDTTQQAMFAPFYPERQPTNQQKQQPKTNRWSTSETPGKVNGICERIRSHLMSLGEGEEEAGRSHFLRLYPVVLCCYVMETPSRVSAALDPKEYLPILNGLKQKAPSTYQKFHIDMHLEDWNSALGHIATLSQLQQKDVIDTNDEDKSEVTEGEAVQNTPNYLEECLKLVQQQKLYSSALKLFCGRPNYKDICAITAKELEKNGRLREAAILHEKAEDLASAMRCHLNLSHFSEYCRLAKLHEQSDEKTESELRKMGTQMVFKDDHLGAAEVFLHLGKEKNVEKILECYEKANAWIKLSAFVTENQSTLHGIVNRAQVLMSTRCAQIIEQIDSWRDTITKHTKRLEVLREEKRAKIEAKQTASAGDDQLDGFSESSVTSSSFSDSSSKESRSFFGLSSNALKGGKDWFKLQRMERQKRKKLMIKEGSHWEDGALLVALKDIYQRIDTQQDELLELLPALLSMDLVDRACRLQNEMLTFLEFVAEIHAQLWPSHLEAFHLTGPLALHFDANSCEPMPRKIHLTDELMPPKLRSKGTEWKLEIVK